MVLDTRENSEIIKQTEWEDSTTTMATSTRENLEMIKQMAKGLISTVQGLSTLGAGEMIRRMDMEERIGMMVLIMKGISKVD
jgi:hypothetical protein